MALYWHGAWVGAYCVGRARHGKKISEERVLTPFLGIETVRPRHGCRSSAEPAGSRGRSILSNRSGCVARPVSFAVLVFFRLATPNENAVERLLVLKLYLADVHLHRARLFRDKAEVAKARVLSEKHGCGRNEELEDAEAATDGW